MTKVNLYNMKKEVVGDVELSDIFNVEYNEPVIHQVVVAVHNNQRQGTMANLTRSEVRGKAAKPWRQKGTGSARQGSRKGPQWTGGGIVFAKKPRDFSQKVNKKVKDLALCSALSQKLRQDELFIVDSIKVDAPKTKVMADMLDKFGFTGKSVAIVTDGVDDNVLRSSNNIQKLNVNEVRLLNACDIVENKFVVLTLDALKKLEEAF